MGARLRLVRQPCSAKIRGSVKRWAGKKLRIALKQAGGEARRHLLYAIKQGYFQRVGFVAPKLPIARKCHPRPARDPQVPENALTLCGTQLCWSVLHRKKTLENRSWRLKPGWYALHCSSTAYGVNRLTPKQKSSCGKDLPEEEALQHYRGQLLGVFRIGERWTYEQCKKDCWAVRQESKKHGTSWCHEIAEVVNLSAAPLKATGTQLTWKLPRAVRVKLAHRMRRQLQQKAM